MLFSKLLRVNHSSGMAKLGRIACLSDCQKAWSAFSLRPFSIDNVWSDNQNKYQEKAEKHVKGNDQTFSNFHFPLTISSIRKNLHSSSESVISRQQLKANSRFLSSSSSSLPILPMTIRPTTIFQTAGHIGRKVDNQYSLQAISCRLFSSSSQGKNGNSENSPNTSGKDPVGQSNTVESPCQPPIRTVAIKDGFQTRDSVGDFLSRLTEDQKKLLYHSLNVEVLRDKYEGHLGSSMSESHHYLSRFGRPTAALSGKEDPTGTLCEVSPKWLHARLDEKSYPPSAGAIWAVGIKNALPFIGFGFLDNLIMILAGDYIDITIGTTLGISTMAAAALGNTISDVAGIGSAWYIEDLAKKIGIKDPELTPSQLLSWPIRWASNGGRAIGVVIGCLLGMVPLLFLPSAEEKEDKEKEKGKSSSGDSDSSKLEKDSLPKDKK